MRIHSLLHCSLIVEDLTRARAFYEGVLGLMPSASRPAMSFDGVWYDIGPQQIHLLCLPNPDKGAARPEHGGNEREGQSRGPACGDATPEREAGAPDRGLTHSPSGPILSQVPLADYPGRDRHVALGVSSIDELAERLEQSGIAYTRSQSGRAALFARDPDGNALEFIEC